MEMINSDKILTYEAAYVGMRVRDKDEDFGDGSITNIDNPHNVFVNFDNESTGIYCLVKECNSFDPIYII